MATVQVTVPDALVPRLTAAARATFPQYAAFTAAETFKKVTADYWRGILIKYESGQAMTGADAILTAAYQAALTQASTDGSTIT